MAELIPMFRPRIGPGAERRIHQAMRRGWISQGRQVKAFEEGFCAQFALPRALALNSGTAALHLALLALGVGPGDEVISSAQTFVATALAALYVGATPVFADLKPKSANLDPAELKRKLSPRSKAVVAVHYGGCPCDMDEIRAFASQHGLVLVEDAAQALGASYRGRSVGALGDAGAFSFQAIKGLTTGDGGMLACAREEEHLRAKRLRWFGIDREGRRPDELGAGDWPISELGYKYHMNDLAASLGLGGLESHSQGLARRRRLNAAYRDELAPVAGLTLLEEPSDRESACWLFTLLAPRRLDFVRAMKSRGVEASVWHRRIDRHPLFGGMRDDLPRLGLFDEQQVSIPLRETLHDGEAAQILKSVKQGW